MNKKPKKEEIHRTFRLAKLEDQDLQKKALTSGISVSELIRKYVSTGLTIDGYKDDIDFIRQQIREELNIQLKPSVDRMVKLIVKSGIVSAAGYFLTAEALSEFVHPARQREYEEVLLQSKKLGVDYFRNNLQDANTFLDKFLDNDQAEPEKNETNYGYSINYNSGNKG